MPKKKIKDEGLQLKFTGKMSILIEVEDYGPMEFRINDLDTAMKIVEVLLKETDNTTTVNAYNKRTENIYKKILDDINE